MCPFFFRITIDQIKITGFLTVQTNYTVPISYSWLCYISPIVGMLVSFILVHFVL